MGPESNLGTELGLLRVALIQTGARRDYELARMLSAAGVLSSFHTTAGWRAGRNPSGFARAFFTENQIVTRTVTGVAAEKVHSSFLAEFVGQMWKRLGFDPLGRKRIENAVLGRQILWRGLGDANVLFTVDGNGGGNLIKRAKRGGLMVATDVVITPFAYARTLKEQRQFPGNLGSEIRHEQIRRFESHYRFLAEESDVLLCPSEFVAEEMIALDRRASKKVEIVPYGMGEFQTLEAQPERGRVLFAGNDAIRKGLRFFAEAAELLADRSDIKFVVAGQHGPEIKNHPYFRRLEFLGKLTRRQMADEFRRAQIFCLPSVAEGSASVVLEAMAAGTPCLTTPMTGSPVTSGVNGYSLEGDIPTQIAGYVRSIVDNPELAQSLSSFATATVSSNTQEKLTERLVEVLARRYSEFSRET